MRAVLFSLTLASVALPGYAQYADGAFSVSLNVLKPLYTDFVDQTGNGFRIQYTRFKNASWGWGLDVSYTTPTGYVPRQTYYYPGGAITTDVYNYMYYLTASASVQYFYKPSWRFTPYALLAAGAAYTEYTLFYNVYRESEDKVSPVLRPEAGLLFRFREYGSLGLKTAVAFEYAWNRNKQYEVDNFYGAIFQIGIVLFTD
jgi:hypothetical protein